MIAIVIVPTFNMYLSGNDIVADGRPTRLRQAEWAKIPVDNNTLTQSRTIDFDRHFWTGILDLLKLGSNCSIPMSGPRPTDEINTDACCPSESIGLLSVSISSAPPALDNLHGHVTI